MGDKLGLGRLRRSGEEIANHSSTPAGTTILKKVEPAQFPGRGLGLRRSRARRIALPA